MVCIFLDVLPLEIRNQIYVYVLCPTGGVTLEKNNQPTILSFYPSNIFNPLRLDILRTCKRIYHEGTEVFWRYNAFHTDLDVFPSHKISDHAFPWEYLRKRVQTMNWHFQFGHSSWGWMRDIFHKMDWANGGALKEIVWTISGIGAMSLFGDLVKGRCYIERLATPPDGITIHDLVPWVRKWYWLQVFLVYAGKHFSKKPNICSRGFQLFMGAQHASLRARQAWLVQHPADDCEETLRIIHESLRGDVYVDGHLCYRNNVTIRETFKSWEVDIQLEQRSIEDENKPSSLA